MNEDKINLSSDFARPSNVPKEAIWVGGADGGIFLTCLRHEKYPYIYLCKIYNDFTGEIEAEGAFVVSKPGDTYIELNDKDLFNSWDGDYIYLRDGRRLEPSNLLANPITR